MKLATMEDDGSFLASESPKHFMQMSLVLRQNMQSMNNDIAWTNSKLSLLGTSHDSLRLRERLYESLHHAHNVAQETFVGLKEFAYRAPCFPSEQEEWSRYREALQEEFTGILSALWELQQVVYAKEKGRVERALVAKTSSAEVHLKGGSQHTAVNRSLHDQQGALMVLERDMRAVDELGQAYTELFCYTITEPDSQWRYCNPSPYPYPYPYSYSYPDELKRLACDCTSVCCGIGLAFLFIVLVYWIVVILTEPLPDVIDGR